jgi:hypothetical protein
VVVSFSQISKELSLQHGSEFANFKHSLESGIVSSMHLLAEQFVLFRGIDWGF